MLKKLFKPLIKSIIGEVFNAIIVKLHDEKKITTTMMMNLDSAFKEIDLDKLIK